jgi:predicted dehydrogenase
MKTVKGALVGYGMFGADVVIGSLWDVQRNGIAPYLDRVGLDDWSARYQGVGFELVAVGTRSAASARRAEAEMLAATGRPLRGYHGDTPWLDILRDFPDLDVLIVATPDHLHTAPTLAALEHGVHVITEKPLCLDLTEADRIIDLARRKDRIVAVDMHKRYDPDHLRIFQELGPSLGTPLYARGVLEEPLEVSTSTFKWVEQSDPFSYVGIHWVDLFMHYLDLTPLALYGVGQKRRLKEEHGLDAFDSTQVMVTHTNGMTIIYENNWLTPADFEGPVNQDSQLVATRGKVESDSQYRGLRYWTENGGSRTANTHFFRKVRRPDGSLVSLGYGKDSLVLGLEKVFRCVLGLANANDLAGSYADAASLRRPTAVVHAARAVIARNAELFAAGQAPVAAASFGTDEIVLHDPAGGPHIVFQRGRNTVPEVAG